MVILDLLFFSFSFSSTNGHYVSLVTFGGGIFVSRSFEVRGIFFLRQA